MIFERVKNGKLPEYKHIHDAALDAFVREDTIVPAWEPGKTVRVKVPLGFKVKLEPELILPTHTDNKEPHGAYSQRKLTIGTAMRILPRSGLTKDGMAGIELNAIGNPVSNTAILGFDAQVADGTVDPDYPGEVSCAVISHDTRAFMIPAETRICQCMITPFVRIDVEEGIVPENENRKGGYGSSGIF